MQRETQKERETTKNEVEGEKTPEETERERDRLCFTVTRNILKSLGLIYLGDRHKMVAVPEWLWDLTRDYVGFLGYGSITIQYSFLYFFPKNKSDNTVGLFR